MITAASMAIRMKKSIRPQEGPGFSGVACGSRFCCGEFTVFSVRRPRVDEVHALIAWARNPKGFEQRGSNTISSIWCLTEQKLEREMQDGCCGGVRHVRLRLENDHGE